MIQTRPILFSGPMVRAILDGRKTQTRRVVKLTAELRGRGCTALDGSWVFGAGQYLHVPGPDETSHRLHSPYGYKGDHLWARETWYCDHSDVQKGPYLEVPGAKELLVYAADPGVEDQFEAERPDWKPSIHMPRWACRLELQIVGVRVERLREISEEDAKAEGIWNHEYDPGLGKGGKPGWCVEPGTYFGTALHAFESLWDARNAKRGFGWESNPFVWVLEFKRVEVARG